jgi:hypothetical protein
MPPKRRLPAVRYTCILPAPTCVWLQIEVVLCVFRLAAESQASQCANVTIHGNEGRLVADSIRPIDAIANTLAQRYGIVVSAEEPQYLFSGDFEDIKIADHEWSATHPQTHYLVPKRRHLEIRFPAFSDGSPRDVWQLLLQIVKTANAELPFGYRLDSDSGFFPFVPTRTHDATGTVVQVTPLLDRRVTIPFGNRSIRANGMLVADSLSSQTGLKVDCCQSIVVGIPWGLAVMPFEASDEPARKVLERLIRLESTPPRDSWLLRCDDSGGCFINVTSVWGGQCGPMSVHFPDQN